MTLAPARYPDLADKVVLVTGGASGIGEWIVRAFAQQGSKVGFIDIAEEAGRKLEQELGSGKAGFIRADITDVPMLKDAIGAVAQRFGVIDVLVNNAARDDREDTLAITQEFWDQQIAVNLRHQFFASQSVLEGMKSKGGGSIINLSSISWMTGQGGMAPYTACKSAVLGLTRSLARDFGAFNIRVNAVSPGWILTERQKRLWVKPDTEEKLFEAQCLKRWLMPAEIANFIVFLASSGASACTSQNFVVDGGWA